MSRLDTKKVSRRARDAYERGADRPPSKGQRKEKRKERQDGKAEIRREIQTR